MNDCFAGHGWERLVEDALAALKERALQQGFAESDVRVTCVKEKFATLRIYVEAPFDTEDITEHAENVSAITCQECSRLGRRRGRTWFATLCDQHALERGYSGHLDVTQPFTVAVGEKYGRPWVSVRDGSREEFAGSTCEASDVPLVVHQLLADYFAVDEDRRR